MTNGAEKKDILSRALPGFLFASGAVFAADVSEEVFYALLGDYRSISPKQARIRARDSVTELFTAALGQAFLYKALRGGPIVWETIADSVFLHGELYPHEAQVAVDVLIAARRAFTGNRTDNLTALVDQFASVVDETVALGPAQTMSLTVHEGNPALESSSQRANRESAAIITSLAEALSRLHVQHPWPPAYFPRRDLLVLARAPITRILAGVDIEHPDLPANTVAPIASSRGTPLALQIALCRQALTNYRPSSDWALLLSPVGFQTHDAAEAWFRILGPHHAKPFVTVPSLFSAATEAFSASRGKKFAVAMLTNWYRVPGFVVAVASGSGAGPSQTWLNDLRTQRFASVMILRRVFKGKKEKGKERKVGIQVIWYDPWMHAAEVKEQAKPNLMSVLRYRSSMVDAVKRWAVDAGLPIHSRYYGGYGAMHPDINGDSVKLCLAYLERIVSGESMGDMFPRPDDEEGFNNLGYKVMSE